MRALPYAAGLTLRRLALAAILSAGCAPSGAEGGNVNTVPVEFDGRTIQIAVPAGMSYAEELLPVYAGMVRDMGADARAVFWPDSSLAALRGGASRADLKVAAAVVAVFKGDLAQTAEQVRGFFAYESTNRERILKSYSTDTTEYARVQGVLRQDPEGRDDIPLPLGPGPRVGLASFHLEDRAGIQIQANSLTVQSAGGPVSMTSLRAIATVIVGDRVLGMFLVRNSRPTTRAVADLSREIRAWVQETLAANDAKIAGESRKDPESADSSETYPKLGDFVYVEELPEAVRKVPPNYPEAARTAGISGTVMVQALIGRDGRVKDTRIIKSIPALDRDAVLAVRQWEFKPARAKKAAIAVWVAIPVKFTLN